MKYKVKCPVCECPSILDREPGAYFYIAKAGCNHRKEVFGVVNTFDKLQRNRTVLVNKENRRIQLNADIAYLDHAVKKSVKFLSGRISEIC